MIKGSIVTCWLAIRLLRILNCEDVLGALCECMNIELKSCKTKIYSIV